MAQAIEKYGIEAVTGEKIIRVRLFRDINIATNVINGYAQQQEAMNSESGIAEWVEKNPELSAILDDARKAAQKWLE